MDLMFTSCMKTSGLVPYSEGTLHFLSFKSLPADHQLVIQHPKHSQNSLSQSCFAQQTLSELYLFTVLLNLWTSSWYIHISTLGHRPLHKPHMKSRPLQSNPSSLSPLTKGSFQTRYFDDQRRDGSKVVQTVGTWTSQVAVGPGRLVEMTATNTVDWKTSGELLTSWYDKLSY